ncbi:MAG: PBP1A family penicillin-binding protein [Firmicutes bacterium]|nr:PBP1A family penicillin-binding protein [Bacillota bacterium]
MKKLTERNRNVGKRAKRSWNLIPEIGLGIVLLLLLAMGVYILATPLPAAAVPLASQLFDLHGEPIAKFYSQNRVEVPLTEIAASAQNAVVAVEDYRFYEHFGFDPVAVTRALVRNIRAGKVVEGGSTITQQLAKNLYLTHERTLQRKLKELLLTFKLETRYSKDQILRLYLNTIDFGHGAYGVEVAAQTYFGKQARDLTLAEAALIAGLPRSPGVYSPYIDPSAALARRRTVLEAMALRGYISAEEAERAAEEPLRLAGLRQGPGRAPYFVDYVFRELEKRYSRDLLHKGGLKIYTTLDLKIQEAAEQAFAQGLAVSFTDKKGVSQPQGALVALDPAQGSILAMIGGRNFAESPLNRALAPRQPGSAFKPFVYLAALENGYTAASTIFCEPISLPVPGQMPWTPTDYGAEDYHYRPLTLREALTISDNVVSARLNYELGPAKGVAVAHDLGISGRLTPHLSSVLGTNEVTPLDMAVAFSSFANGGSKVEPWAIRRVEDRYGRVMEKREPRVQQVIDSKVVYILTSILQDVTQPGGTASVVGRILARPAAGKTGTSQGNAWFVGYTPELTAAVYVGNDTPVQDVYGTGGGLAAPIFANFVAAALKDRPVRDFDRPRGLVELEVCRESGLLATRWCPADKVYKEVFVPGTQPWQPCTVHTPWGNWQDSWPFNYFSPDELPPKSGPDPEPKEDEGRRPPGRPEPDETLPPKPLPKPEPEPEPKPEPNGNFSPAPEPVPAGPTFEPAAGDENGLPATETIIDED